VRPQVVVVIHVLVKSSLDLFAAGVELLVQKLVPQLVKEALDLSILPGASGLDEPSFNPFRKLQRSELRAVV